MDKLLEMAGKAGMDKSQSEAAAGGVLSLLKKNLPEGQFNTILEKVPGAKDMVEKQEATASKDAGSGGGMGGMLGSAMSSFGGGGGSSGSSTTGDMAGLMASLSSKGINPSMMSKYLPMVSTFMKEKCGVDVSSLLGVSGGGESSGTAAGDSSGGGAMGSLSGMASNFLKK